VPELPEIEVLRRSLEPRLVGLGIRRVEVRSPALREPLDRRRLRRVLPGRTIERLGRRGKYLLVELAGGWTLVVHLGMSGRLTLVPRRTPGEPHEHLVLGLDRGVELRLRDPRRFGLAFVAETAALPRDRHLAHLGREPLEPKLSGAELAGLARGLRAPVKSFLMDGTRLVGVGNIYATEALFRAGIHPFRSVARIGPARWVALAAAVVEVLEDAIRQGGTTLNDFRDGAGNPGEFQVDLAVYDREGLPCPRCGALVLRRVRSNRSAYYCPRCQR
jgi:formamidopyrimidine-DNA glycosylase